MVRGERFSQVKTWAARISAVGALGLAIAWGIDAVNENGPNRAANYTAATELSGATSELSEDCRNAVRGELSTTGRLDIYRDECLGATMGQVFAVEDAYAQYTESLSAGEPAWQNAAKGVGSLVAAAGGTLLWAAGRRSNS